ncbi:MAG: succinate dehydrogenase assembly factor 2 [Burkholderiaceae bacterium]|nr:succinate dehydrogenase assembly factor 2 [Burkholderiaceae bacterium]
MTSTLPHFVSSLPPEEAVPCLGQPGAAAQASQALVDERELSKLRWRCRRGLLENDLFIERFFNKYADRLTVKQAQGLNVLMDLSDNDLLDLHLARKSLEDLMTSSPALDCREAREVLAMLRHKD